MGTNLRLDDELAAALRERSSRTGRSQQEIVRVALAKELGLVTAPTAMQRAIDAGTVHEPDPFEDLEPTLRLPRGTSSLDLLDRDDR